ncbi:MAG: penicillin-binding transpeptidase domain-containing protein [Bacillota bacterium]|nr:penicillin-binding transpeptidase domain-containing protein [Bacillota bacterium]
MGLLQNRGRQIFLVMLVLIGVLVLRMVQLTVLENQTWSSAAESLSIRSVSTAAPRGEILDRYGRLLAGNQLSFTVQMSEGYLDSEELNRQALEVTAVLESNGDSVNDNLPIIMDGSGGFYYTYQKETEEWLASMDMPVDFTAEEAFRELRNRYEVDEGLDEYGAQAELQNTYNVYPPISVVNMKFTQTLNLESFLGRYGDDYLELTAEEAFRALREEFGIDPGLSDEDARKIMVIRNELAAQGYYSYIPVEIAQGISDESIVTLEERSTDLTAIEVANEYVRYYPNGSVAAHILGYMGKITESELSTYLEQGYSASDMVGRDGLEAAMEDVLRGTDGTRAVEVNAHGELVRTISETTAEKGLDVYTTIDLELQKVAESALAQALEKISTGGTFESKWGNYTYREAYENANVGAVVAIEVETGDVLAMASNPAYDPNLFATGISSEDWDALQSQNPRDPLSPVPLYNVAARTAVQPGSTFKMVTATAALESGLDPNQRIRDGGAVQLGNRTYGCVVWNLYRSNHGYLDFYEAMEVSCNYYFYDLSTNWDWYRNRSLGLDSDMGIEKITYYAQQYGLGDPEGTGIEIRETIVTAPNAETKLLNTMAALRNVLLGRAEIYFTQEVIDEGLFSEYIAEIVSWTEENPSRNEIISRLGELGVREEQIETVADLCKFSYFNQATWTTGDEMNIAIGQGENAYTPLQIANYVATIGNEGVRNQVSLIYGIEGEGRYQKEAATQIDISDPGILEDIIEGMELVATGSRGSARTHFASFPVQVAAKTGTAERAGKINPPDEVEYIQTYLSRIAPDLTWEEVEAEMERLLEEYPEVYTSQNTAVRQAVLNLRRDTVTLERIDAYKEDYDNFAWFVAMAPAEDPKIAVAVLIFQGGSGPYGAPVAREVIGAYLELDKEYQLLETETALTE